MRRRLGCVALVAAAAVAVVPALAATLGGAPHVPTYGLMLHPFGKKVTYQSCGFHTGQDWFAPTGTPVFAIEAGVVVWVGPLWRDAPDAGRGPHAVVVDHGRYVTTYSHNDAAAVEVGERVARGQRIASIGNEGYSGAPHVHLEKVDAPFSGDWRVPFEGCDVYVDPGDDWSWF